MGRSTGVVGSRLAVAITAVIVTTVILAGGVAMAAVVIPANSVNSAKIVNNSVTGADIRTNTVQSSDIKDATVGSIDIADGSVAGADIADGTVGTADITDNSVSSADLAAQTVDVTDVVGALLPRWAKIDPDSTGSGAMLLNGREVASLGRFNVGVYFVLFNDSVANCGWTATLFDNEDGVLAASSISVEKNTANGPTALIIRTFNTAGVPVDLNTGDGYVVQVDC